MPEKTSRNDEIVRRYKRGDTLRSIGDDFGLTGERVRMIAIARVGHRGTMVRKDVWTADETAFVVANYNRGMTAGQIAKTLKRTKNEVIGKAYRTLIPKEKSPTRGLE